MTGDLDDFGEEAHRVSETCLLTARSSGTSVESLLSECRVLTHRFVYTTLDADSARFNRCAPACPVSDMRSTRGTSRARDSRFPSSDCA
jgi:hypothetical protein